jgi:hypothetical protein
MAEIKGGWGKLHNEKVHEKSPSPGIIRINKPRSM